jgi:hypothetical protein
VAFRKWYYEEVVAVVHLLIWNRVKDGLNVIPGVVQAFT